MLISQNSHHSARNPLFTRKYSNPITNQALLNDFGIEPAHNPCISSNVSINYGSLNLSLIEMCKEAKAEVDKRDEKNAIRAIVEMRDEKNVKKARLDKKDLDSIDSFRLQVKIFAEKRGLIKKNPYLVIKADAMPNTTKYIPIEEGKCNTQTIINTIYQVRKENIDSINSTYIERNPSDF